MKSAEAIEDEFRQKALLRGRALLFQPADAIRLIRRCREAKLRILGIDGFLLTETRTQPCIEHSVDFSSSALNALGDDNWERAEEFLRVREASGLLFEVTIE